MPKVAIPDSAERAAAKGLLAVWAPRTIAEDSHALLLDWDNQSFAAIYRLEGSEVYWGLFETAVGQNALFDCFQIAGWEPDENSLSNAIAALFDASWGHSYSVLILRAVLNKIAEKTPAERRLAITRVLEYLNESEPRVSVRRERWGDQSRADIDICGKKFLLRIEHKLRGTPETRIGKKAQTERLYGDALRLADNLGIDHQDVITVLLSAGERYAEHRSFIVLTFEEFSHAVLAALAESFGLSELPSAAASILGFMSFYGRKL